MTKPAELEDAEMVIEMCQLFSCLPDELDRQDVSILRLVHIARLGQAKDQ